MKKKRDGPKENKKRKLNPKAIEKGFSKDILLPELTDEKYQRQPIHIYVIPPKRNSFLKEIIIGVTIILLAAAIMTGTKRTTPIRSEPLPCPVIEHFEINHN